MHGRQERLGGSLVALYDRPLACVFAANASVEAECSGDALFQVGGRGVVCGASIGVDYRLLYDMGCRGFAVGAGNNYGFGSSNITSAISAHPAMNTTPTPLQPVQTSMPQAQASVSSINSDPNCYIEFNGQDVDLYKYGQNDGNRLQNGQLQDNLNGQSGGDDYQSKIHQDVSNKGPIPEGTYYANQNQRQNITALDAVAGIVGHGKWPGSVPAWGTKRVWLQPDANTNTYGRSGFTIHGGWSKGSAGCIDIPWQTGRLSNYLDDCQDSVPVYVKYPKNW
jgi:hypothetical protein